MPAMMTCQGLSKAFVLHTRGGARIQVAKALANNPPLLLLDEVTSGLDVSVQARVLDLIRELQRELAISMIVVSHDMGVIRLLAERTLVMKPQGGFFGLPFDNVFRGPSHPLKVGDRVKLTGMTVEINALTEDARPDQVSFRFSVPLEDPSLRWLRWEEGYVPFAPPAVGRSVLLPAARPLFSRRGTGSTRSAVSGRCQGPVLSS